MIVKREREIQAFVPEPYWLVHATLRPALRGPLVRGRRDPARTDGERADGRSPRRSSGKDGIVESVERKEQSERAPLLYDLTSLQRDANRRFGFSARRTLQAAQSLYEGKKAITYPRTNSRWLSGDLVPQLKPTAAHAAADPRVRGRRPLRARPRAASARPRRQRRQGRGPPRDHPDRRRARRALRSRPTSGASSTWSRAASSPSSSRPPATPARPSSRWSRTSASARAGRSRSTPGWRGVYGLEADADKQRTEDEDAEGGELPGARAGPEGRRASRPRASARRRGRRRATRRRRCSPRWRPPAS